MIQELNQDLTLKLKNADTDAQRNLINKDHENALALAKSEHEKTLTALDKRIGTNKKSTEKIKRQRDRDLKNIDQKIERQKRNCKRSFQEALDLLEKEHLISEEKLGKCLSEIEQDSTIFLQSQREALKDLETRHQNELARFNQKQGSKTNDFNQSQKTAEADFQNQLKNRLAIFDAEIANCRLKVEKQKELFTRSQDIQIKYFAASQSIQSQDCQRRTEELTDNFKNNQISTVLIYEKEKEQKNKDFEKAQELSLIHI